MIGSTEKKVGSLKISVSMAAIVLTLAAGVPAFAQDYLSPDYDVGPRERNRDELARPYELDGLELGREAPFISSEDLELRNPGRAPGGSFEIEAPPIGDQR